MILLKDMLETTLSRPHLETANNILCCYQNTTSQIQVVRVFDSLPRIFEKIVFPGERLLFEAFSHAELQVYTNSAECSAEVNRILCSQLQVCESTR
ncbi:MAG TPA: DUF1830 domain-containing protein [Leptolyngbyaceae cyanobacterium]